MIRMNEWVGGWNSSIDCWKENNECMRDEVSEVSEVSKVSELMSNDNQPI